MMLAQPCWANANFTKLCEFLIFIRVIRLISEISIEKKL